MVELFRIAEGPWEKIFEGVFQKHSVQILSNPESMLLVAIFDTEGEKTKGVIAEFYKVFYAVGSAENFAETLPRELVVLTKHDSKKTLKFLLVESNASYIEWSEEQVMQETNAMLLKLKASSEMIKDVSKAYDLKLMELKQSPAEVKEAFFTHPLLIPVISTNYQPASMPSASIEQGIGVRPVAGEAILGITKEGNLVEEPLNLLMKAGIFEGSEPGRNLIMQVLVESALLSNIPAVVFDWKASFEGLSMPTKDAGKLKEFKLDLEPSGFPIKKFLPLKEVQANINALKPEGLLELFGISLNNAPAKIIIQAMQSAKHSSFKEVCDSIKKEQLSAEVTVYQQLKAIRYLTLINLRYLGFFDSANNIEEVSKNWMRSIGRASIIELSSLDSRQALMLIAGIVKEMLAFYKERGVSKQAKSMILIPEIEKLANYYKNAMFKDFAQALSELKDYGVGFALSIPKEIDLEESIMKALDAEFGIVSQNDAGIKMPNKKQYRVLIRPTLSEFKG